MRHSRTAAAHKAQQNSCPSLNTLRFRLTAITCLLSGVSVFYTFHRTVPPHAVEVGQQKISFMATYRSKPYRSRPLWDDENAADAKLPVCKGSRPSSLGYGNKTCHAFTQCCGRSTACSGQQVFFVT